MKIATPEYFVKELKMESKWVVLHVSTANRFHIVILQAAYTYMGYPLPDWKVEHARCRGLNRSYYAVPMKKSAIDGMMNLMETLGARRIAAVEVD